MKKIFNKKTTSVMNNNPRDFPVDFLKNESFIKAISKKFH